MTKQIWNKYEDGPVPANWKGPVYPASVRADDESWNDHMFATRDVPNCQDGKVY